VGNNQLTANSIKDAGVWINPDPKRIDVLVTYLQPLLQALEWNNKAYSRAIKFSRIEGNKDYIYPALFVGEGIDYLDALQLDDNVSYTFFYTEDSERSVNPKTGKCVNEWEQVLKLYVWLDMEQVNINNGFDVAPEIKDSVISIFAGLKPSFRVNGQFIQSLNIEAIYEDPFKVFEGFSIQQSKHQWLYYPYKALRFDIKVVYLDTCMC